MQVHAVMIGLPTPVPILAHAVRAGFPSPADDFIEDEIDLQRLLIANRPATFLVRVAGDSMVLAKLFDGDIAVVDRSLKPLTATWWTGIGACPCSGSRSLGMTAVRPSSGRRTEPLSSSSLRLAHTLECSTFWRSIT